MLTLLTKGNLIRYQVVLVSGDIAIALAIFFFAHDFWPYLFRASGSMNLITPVLLMVSYLCGRYQTAAPGSLRVLFYSIFFILIGLFIYLICSAGNELIYYRGLVLCLILFFLLQAGWHRLVHDLYKSRLLKQNIIVLGTGPIAEKVERLIQANSDQYSLSGFIATPKDLVTVELDKIIGEIEHIAEIATSRYPVTTHDTTSLIIPERWPISRFRAFCRKIKQLAFKLRFRDKHDSLMESQNLLFWQRQLRWLRSKGRVIWTFYESIKHKPRPVAHSIIIALTEKRGNPFMDQLISCKLKGIRIIEYPTFCEMLTGKIPIEDINPSWLVQSNGFLITPMLRRVKRCLDIVAGGSLLIIVSPFILPIVLIIKSVSPGPAFYTQERVGLDGNNFTIYKFRSMRVDAEKETGPIMNSSINDDRIFPFGAFMRKTRIDELPQLINVLKGDMSFIGPRPERPAFVKQITRNTKFYNERHAVKPGITGWAQVMFRYGSDIGDSVEKLRYDLYYINNMSLVLDLLIVLETIKVVLFRKGSM